MTFQSSDSLIDMPIGIPLSKYTALITNTLAAAKDLSGVWIVAELSDVRFSGGHCYMELIEKNESGLTVAKLRATIWRTTYFQLRQKFFNATQREITSGIKALIRGSINHHSLYGISLNIIDIDPSYTLGDLERLRREIIHKLQKEGVANMNKSLPFPKAPQKIAIISAEGAAGYGDFIKHLLGNSYGFVFYPCLFPCLMQGDKASLSIRHALEVIESSAHIWDCVVIVRGGGATTDLNGFDDYELAKAVATCGIPVVVGIGHERDRNVLDEIANISLKTPTAVASFFIDEARQAYENVIDLADKIRYLSTEIIRGEERLIASVLSLLPQLAFRRLNDANSELEAYAGKIPLLLQGKIGKEKLRINGINQVLDNLIKGKIGKETIRIEGLKQLLANVAATSIHNNNLKIDSLEKLFGVLDPKNTLKRGYSITRINGKAIKNIENINNGDIITTTLHDGEIRSTVMQG